MYAMCKKDRNAFMPNKRILKTITENEVKNTRYRYIYKRRRKKKYARKRRERERERKKII